ncbi:xanthine dehydrogenase accessory factor [Pseudarthrobacter oxydans]|uniref:XdhC family protein n=1 Tax=Pseudarthrobacter oxydans TaxID=1671 RepID=UPI00277FBDC1|nr:XdhC/CoxI family protein [Pseudarthrobacter oxydans]MDP9983860.1 xanthine dehydrogenase accessory factor [Pseudarthrobacter oxydans]
MLDLMPSLGEWWPATSGRRCAVATVVGTGGSVPRPVGTSMLVSEAGDVLGSLSGGCVEGAVVAAALEVMADGGTRREFFGYSNEDAFAVGLTCGGELDVHIELLADTLGGLRPEGLTALDAHDPAAGLALIRRIDAHGPEGAGYPRTAGAVVIPDPASYRVAESDAVAALLAVDGGARSLLQAAAAQLEPLLRNGTTGVVRLAAESGCHGDAAAGPATEPITLLVESRLPPARMLVFGANDFGAALVPAARLLGYHVTLCDARPAFAGQDRFAAADQVVTDWPHRYLAAEAAAGRLDARTVVCVLTHDPKFDLPLLQAALGLELAYIGAMGSRRSHAQRMASLLAAGVAPEEAERLHSPIGLDLGAVTPAEVAVSITAELVAGRSRSAPGLSLKHGSGPIHHFVNSPQHQEMPWT